MRGETLEAERVHSIVGGFLTVYNYFGYGLSERVYSGALVCELHDRRHVVERELSIDVRYKGRRVAGQRLDMVIDDRIVVEIKATEKLCPADRSQLLNYLRASKFEVGILLHFGPMPRFERYVDHPKRAATTCTGTQSTT
jgi:GxxExxY protein